MSNLRLGTIFLIGCSLLSTAGLLASKTSEDRVATGFTLLFYLVLLAGDYFYHEIRKNKANSKSAAKPAVPRQTTYKSAIRKPSTVKYVAPVTQPSKEQKLTDRIRQGMEARGFKDVAVLPSLHSDGWDVRCSRGDVSYLFKAQVRKNSHGDPSVKITQIKPKPNKAEEQGSTITYKEF